MDLPERNLLEDLYQAGGRSIYKRSKVTEHSSNTDSLAKENYVAFDASHVWLTEKGSAHAKKLLKL